MEASTQETKVQVGKTNELSPLVMDRSSDSINKASLDTLGVSVYHLQTEFMQQVHGAGLNHESLVYELEDLQKDQHGVIRRRGAGVVSPVDGRIGAAYVHCLDGPDHVGLADYMLSYVWG